MSYGRRWIAIVPVFVVALLLGAAAIHSADQTRDAESAHPPIGKFVQVDEARLHVLQEGTGTPVVLLHGNPGFVHDWAAVVPLLSARYRVLAVDRPGHGYSERPNGSATTPRDQARLLHEALRTLGVQKPVIVGHSWGGALALLYALEYPDQVAGLVLLGTRAFPTGAGGGVYALTRAPVIGDVFRHTLLLPVGRPMIEQGLVSAYAPDEPPALHAAQARDMWLRPSQASATVWDTRRLHEQLGTTSGSYGEIAVPVTIIVGEHDHPDRESRPLSQEIPGSRLVVLRGTGHQIPHTRPDAVQAAVDEILEQQRDSTVSPRT